MSVQPEIEIEICSEDGFIRGLQKGIYIDQNKCEELIGYKRTNGETEYNFKLINFVTGLVNRSIKINHPLSMSIHNFGIKVHTDSEAMIYHQQQHESGIRKFKRHHMLKKIVVDQHSLSPKELEDYNHSVTKSQRLLEAITKKVMKK